MIRSPLVSEKFPIRRDRLEGWHDLAVPPDDVLLRGLVARAAEGDDHAVVDLIRRTQPSVWRLCTVLGSPQIVEDLVQETYLRALAGLDGYRNEGSVRSWLLGIARNVCADSIRRRRSRERLRERLAGQRDDTRPAPTGVDDLVRALPDDRRDAFVLTQVLGLSYDEAASAMGCPIGTIRSRVARARADLAAAIRQAEAL
jgi:RNA polymerase sigma-70 factor, ECF subfamily